MKICLDVHYRRQGAVAAGVVFGDWTDDKPVDVQLVEIGSVRPYRAGRFYERELPCLLDVLDKVRRSLDTIVIDGYVWLRRENDPGLGMHLYRALRESVPVVGVAKSEFHHATAAREVYRGKSQRPLYVTACGMDLDTAAVKIGEMHGPFRIPTLLRRVDQLCRCIQS